MRSFIHAAIFGLVSRVAALDVKCAKAGVCFGLGISDRTASSNDNDIFFKLTAPGGTSWVSLGQGSQMDGANMFVIYPSSDGNNITISSRLGNGHKAPEPDSDTQLTVLEGSSASAGEMVAVVRCSNCRSWPGGSMDFTSQSATWIWAIKSGEPINSDNPDEAIAEHDDYGDFTFDFLLARSGQSLNPFIGSDQSFNNTDTSLLTDSGASSSTVLLIAHGVMASAAFVILFPFGAIIIRLLHFQRLIWMHAAIQIFSYLVFAAGAGIGIWLAIEEHVLSDSHVIIGLTLLGVLFFQPLLGQIHHTMFKKHHRRTIWSHVHIWLGRTAILLGIVNGGLGLELADNTSAGMIAYAVVAAIAGITYIAAIAYGERRRSRTVTKSAHHDRSPRSEEVDLSKAG